MIKLQKTVTSVLEADCLYCLLRQCGFVKQAGTSKMSMCKELRVPQANHQRETEAFCPMVCKELNPAQPHELGSGSFTS